MPRLEVKENKKLVLKNVLIKSLLNIKMENLNQEIEAFTSLLRRVNVQTFGPIVMKNSGVQINETGVITSNYELMVQAHDYKQYKNMFEIKERFECSNCLYLRFEGDTAHLQYAHSKLDLYLYEEELEGTGDVYSLVLQETENYTVVDLFRPVTQL